MDSTKRDSDSADEDGQQTAVVRLRAQIAVSDRRHERDRIPQSVVQIPSVARRHALGQVVFVEFHAGWRGWKDYLGG